MNFYVTEMILNFICMNKWVPWVDFLPKSKSIFSTTGVLFSDPHLALIFFLIMENRKGVDIMGGHAEFLLALFF